MAIETEKIDVLYFLVAPNRRIYSRGKLNLFGDSSHDFDHFCRTRHNVVVPVELAITDIKSSAQRPFQPVSPRRDAAITARMADLIIRQTASAGSVTREDLQLDFTDEQIDAHFEQAKAAARRAGKARS